MITKDIFDRIENGSHIITPTKGLAQSLQKVYAAQQIQQNKQAWPTANIISWYAWCHSLWQSLIFDSDQHPLLLHPAQSLELWCDVIHASRYAKQLLQLQATAKQVQAAYQLFKNWRIESIPEHYFLNQDAFAFKVWMESYELRLKAKDWIDEANLADYLTESSSTIEVKAKQCILYAFDELTPAQQYLNEALTNQGLDIQQYQPDDINLSVGVVNSQDERVEITALGSWVKHCYQEDPDARIGIVVPNLRVRRQSLLRQLERTLTPENYLLDGDSKQSPMTVSIGKPLTDYPMVHLVFCLLQLNGYRIQVDNLSVILRSPFIANHSEESVQRYKFDARVKRHGQPQISFKALNSIHDQLDEADQLPCFFAALKKFIGILEESIERQGMQQWSKTVFELLHCFGWPGDRPLNSDEYQTLETWNTCLEQMASLDVVTRPCHFSAVVTSLFSLCNETSFQPQTDDRNVFIMGTEGVSGMQFDHCWVLGLSDQVWPATDTLNPFIPVKLQQQAGIPNASAVSSLQSAKKLTTNIVRSAKHVVLSYPKADDVTVLRPSPVLEQYPDLTFSWNNDNEYTVAVFERQQLEYLHDAKAPEITKDIAVSGGSALFKDQAACPFRAFAKHRLAARAIDTTDIGLAAIERGLILHRALQIVWQSINHSEYLRRMSDSVLQQRITEAANKAVDEYASASANTLQPRLYELEKQRLIVLVGEWMRIESERSEFSVEATEKGHHILFENITVHMRIDRIDKLADGRLVIIDYKTGDASVNAWFGERPQEPQLPLYAITCDGDVAAIAFAKLKTGDARFIGQTETEGLLPGLKGLEKTEWTTQITQWRETLTGLANEYCSGVADVDPMPGACRYCDLKVLCRISERIHSIEEEME